MEGAIKFFDTIYSDEYGLLLCAGIEGKDYEWKDGVRVSLIDNMTNAEKAAAKRPPGSPLWGEILPRVQLPSGDASREVWEQQQRDGGKTDLKIAALEKAMDYQEWTPLMIDNFLAMATDEETETINKILTGLQTYSDEMCLKLALAPSPWTTSTRFSRSSRTLAWTFSLRSSRPATTALWPMRNNLGRGIPGENVIQ